MSFSSLGIAPAERTYPRWPPAIVEVVEKALYEAWTRVRADEPLVVAKANEDLITDRVKAVLVALRRARSLPGFNSDVFQVPVRDGKQRSGSGESIDMMPDLTFYLAGCRADVDEDDHDGLFFECKVVSKSKGLSLYDQKGMARFVDGRYASRMPHAGMVAYALGGKHNCPEASLPVYLAKTAKGATETNGQRLKWKSTKSVGSPGLGGYSGKLWSSVHDRYLAGLPASTLEPITIRHLWFTN